MKKILIVLAVICTIGFNESHAQEMKKGMSLFNVGLGLVPGFGLNVSYDYGLIDAWGPGIFTIGCYAGFSNWGKTYPAKPHHVDYSVNAFAFAPRATYRYAINKVFEVYGTAYIGAMTEFHSTYYDNRSVPFFAITAGCRYSFGSNIAVFAEIGYLYMSFLNGGLSFSF